MYIQVSLIISKTKVGVYAYSVNKEQFATLKIGSQVVVNFNNQLKMASVVKLCSDSSNQLKLKPIILIYKVNPLNSYQTKIANKIYQNTISSYLKIQALFITHISDSKINIYFYDENDNEAERVDYKSSKNKAQLLASNWQKECIIDDYSTPKTYKYVRLKVGKENLHKLTKKQEQAYEYVLLKKEISIVKLCEEAEVSRAIVNTLVKNNIFELIEKERQFEALYNEGWQKSAKLSVKQQFAFERIATGVNLLHGVSASGKTEIYIELIKNKLKNENQILIIVPSISLAIQTVGKIQNVFDDVIIYHNNLSNDEKLSFQQQINNGHKKIIVATFEGLFLPFKNLHYVIFDEAHSNNYVIKNDINVNKNIIIEALVENDIDVLLGTATPLITDYAQAQYNKINLISLNERFGNSNLPEVKFVKPATNIISEQLIEQININKSRGKPSIIFFNHSGYAKQILCLDCYNLHNCPNCGKPLSYHKAKNKLVCKYDGYNRHATSKCLKCNSKNLKYIGIGIEQFFQNIKQTFPKLNIEIIAGKQSTKQLYEVLQNFNSGQIDVLVGTQSIAFGIDFLNVDNIYVCNIDNLLTLNEVNNHESTYNLLEQVIGRVGRNSKFSTAYIETNFENHFVMQAVKKHDYFKYYQMEMKLRKDTNNQPYYRICKIELLAKNEQKLINISNELIRVMKENKLNVSVIQTPYISIKYEKHRRYFLIRYRHEHIREIIKNNIYIVEDNNIDYNIDLNNYEIGV